MGKRTYATAGLAAAAVIGAGTWALWPASADSLTVKGSLELQGKVLHSGSGQCMGQGGYDDIAQGAPVTVYSGSGEVLATGQLGRGDDHGWTPNDDTERSNQCWFTFTVSVPRSDFYQVEVSHRGKQAYSRSDVNGGTVALTLG